MFITRNLNLFSVFVLIWPQSFVLNVAALDRNALQGGCQTNILSTSSSVTSSARRS